MATMSDDITIKGMRLRNRLALPPLTTNYATPEGLVTKEILQFYRERSGEMGLVIVEATAVRRDGRIVPGSLGLWTDDQVRGMAHLADVIKQSGAAAVVQVNHAGARCIPGEGEMIGASPSGFSFRPDVAAFAMSEEQIETVVSDFADAAGRAADAGFDGVEIHGAHLYLISQFLSPLTNKRHDRYGGDARARTSFALEVVAAARERVGNNYPVLFRLNAVENVDGGQTSEDAVLIGKILAEAGVDALDVSLISQGAFLETEDRNFLVPASALPKKAPAGANAALVAAMKEATGLPTIGVGKLGDGAAVAETLRNSQMDVVAIGRQMIADPGTVGKILAGRDSDILKCEECMTCFASLRKGVPVACKVNPDLPHPGK